MSISSGINKVFLIGNIVKDSRNHSNQIDSQGSIHFTIVTKETLTRNGGETPHEEFHNIVVPGKVANGDSFAKGRMIYLEGTMKTKALIDGEGVKRYRTEIWVNTYKLLT